MTNEEFGEKAAGIVKTIVGLISEKKYKELEQAANIDPSWKDFSEFGEWLDEQLAMWEEDEERKFVVDGFDESCLGKIEPENDGTSFTTYNPTSFGEELDIWFEIKFKAEENGRITAVFNVNC